MQNERQQNNSRCESEKSDDMLKNAELCDDISKWSTSDRESIYWKKQGLSIREKFYGKDNPRLCDFYAEMSEILLRGGEYKKSLLYCEKALKIKEKNNCSYKDVLYIYEVMITNYYLSDELDKGLACGLTVLNDPRIEAITASDSVIQIMKYLAFINNASGKSDEAKIWIQKGIDKAKDWYGEDSVQVAEMNIEKAQNISDPNQKLEILKVALEILLDKVGMYDNRTKKAYRCIWKCWEKETNEPIELALQWLKKNLSNEDFLKVYSWGRSNHKISGKESCK